MNGISTVEACKRNVLSKSTLPGEVHVLIRFRVRSTPHGCAWILAERTLLMILGMMERPGSIIDEYRPRTLWYS